MKIGIAGFVFLLISVANIFAADLCKDVKVEAPEELVMKETRIQLRRSKSSIRNLAKTDVWLIRREETFKGHS